MKEDISTFSSSSAINAGSTKPKVRNFYITLAKESPKNINYDSSSDSYDSFHLRETDYCKDTTDTLSDSSYTTEGIATVDVEYEVASRSASENLYSNDSSSGTEDLVLAVAARAAGIINDSTSDFADTEESNDDIQKDPDLRSADYSKCVRCKNKQNNHKMLYCKRCYQNRKSHFPPRPSYKKRRIAVRRKRSTLNKYKSKFYNYKHRASLSSISDDDNMYDGCISVTSTTLLKNVYSDSNNSTKGFGKFSNNNNNNNYATSSKETSSEFSLSQRLNYKNNNSSRSYLKRKNPFQKVLYLENNTKRRFLDNSSCSSSVTNLTNHYNSSNNTSLITVSSSNNASCSNIIQKRDTNLIINDSKTDSALEIIGRNNDILKLNKDSGISCSSISGPLSSQEYSSSQASGDIVCSSSHSDNLITATNSIHLNLVTSKITTDAINNSSKIKKNDIISLQADDSSTLYDTVSEDLNEKDYDSIDDEILLNNNQNDNENQINLSSKSIEKIENITDDKQLNKTNNLVMVPNYINLNKHISEFPLLSHENNEYLSSTKIDSIQRSISAYSNMYDINNPTSSNRILEIKDIYDPIKKFNKNEDPESGKNIEENQKAEKNNTKNNDSCIICLDEPKNGVFVHTHVLHLCCCYKCAVKIWNKIKKCPVCNCPAKTVLKLFIH